MGGQTWVGFPIYIFRSVPTLPLCLYGEMDEFVIKRPKTNGSIENSRRADSILYFTTVRMAVTCKILYFIYYLFICLLVWYVLICAAANFTST
jgi:hypothetical protein